LALTGLHIDQLLKLCKEGNSLAQMEVYNRYYLAMYNIALRIVKQTDEAEDVMQEAFLTAFTKLDSYKGDAEFGAWLKRIVINNGISKYRKSQYFETLEENQRDDEIFDDEETERVEDFNQLKVNTVLDSINNLKKNYKIVLNLYYIEGYDHEEISEIMKISYANCRTLLSRAKESLRKQLAKNKIES